jgi:flavin reductase (DIM6/NTAB) family NADH-FMN oxidoreductase RutF
MAMHVDPKTLSADESYKLMTGVVVPRPVAWVTTIAENGGVNLAPFSTFTFVSPKPPMLAFSVGQRGGIYKDTARNILANEEYVVHIADRALIDAVHGSAVEHAPDVSEVEMLGLATEPSLYVKPPRVAAAPIAMECRLRQCLEFGETRSRLIVGEVVAFHFRDGLMNGGKIDSKALDPLCRLAGPNYATLGDIVTMQPIFQTAKSTIK